MRVWLLMCSTVVTQARVGGEDITGNGLGQGFISTSTWTHMFIQGFHRCSDAMTPTCRQRPSEHAIDPCRLPTAEKSCACKLHGTTPHIALSGAMKFANKTLSGWPMAGPHTLENGTFQPYTGRRISVCITCSLPLIQVLIQEDRADLFVLTDLANTHAMSGYYSTRDCLY